MQLELRPHQIEAVKAGASALAQFDRTKVVMACGSGKTLVGFRLAESADRVVFFEPSLAMIRQTLQAAHLDGILDGRRVICVCSYRKVGGQRDEWKVDLSDLGVPVTTDAETLRELLRQSGDRCAVFCTYHSQELLAGSMPLGFRFDFGVFDEAHRTAGLRGRPFSCGLSDAQIAIKKRLFLTATPRYFAFVGEAQSDASYSMDDKTVYGSVAYELPLPLAIARGITCDYEIVTSLVSGVEVQQALRRAKQLLLPQKKLPVELVASQIALVRAVQATSARRIVTFHRTIDESAMFAKDRLKLLKAAGISAFHINGEMPAWQREAVIGAFRTMKGPAVLSNCRCLSEGVDVPDIDMIVLNGKRESNEDLTQILGRALRLSEGKERGFVGLPVYVEENESLESALKRSDLEVTWELLHATLESGIVLPEPIVPMRGERTDSGAGTRAKATHLRLVAPDELLDELKNAIRVRWVARLSERWEVMISFAEQYAAREGNLDVAPDHLEDGVPLGSWIARQRRLRRRRRLPSSQEQELTALGLVWSQRESKWERGIAEAKSYFRKHGHLNTTSDDANSELIFWLKVTQKSLNAGNLAFWRVVALKELGMVPLPKKETLLEQFRKWREVNPQGRPRRSGPDRRLAFRLKGIIGKHSKGQIDATTVAQFNELGFDFDAVKRKGPTHYQRFGEQSWDVSYAALQAYVAKNGWLGLWQAKKSQDGIHVNSWVTHQRFQRRHGKLSAERVAKLDALGIEWNRKTAWLITTVDKLEQFRKENGHQRLPPTPEYAKFRRGVAGLRRRVASGKLPPHIVLRLKDIGFVSTVEDEHWEERIHSLKQFVAAEGVAAVGATSPASHAYFFKIMFRRHQRGELLPSRLAELRSLGVSWAALDDTDSQMIARLKAISAEFGKANVEVMALLQMDLAQWLQDQVNAAARGELSERAMMELRRVGIDVREFSPAGLQDTA